MWKTLLLVGALMLSFGCANVVVDEKATQPSVVWEQPKQPAPASPLQPSPALENQTAAGADSAELQKLMLAMLLARANQSNFSGNFSEKDLPALMLLLNNSSASNFSYPQNLPNRVNTSYFYSPNCAYCNRVAPLIQALQSQFSNSTAWGSYNVLTPEGYAAFDQMAKKLNLPNSSRVVPLVVAGNRTFVGEPEINSSLSNSLANLTK